MLSTLSTEAEVIEHARSLFKAHVPESNAWIEPNNFSITATVIGGLFWSTLLEAKNGIDARVMIDTAQGEYLDAIAARPPFIVFRRQATQATGMIEVSCSEITAIPAGETFTRSDGITYVTTGVCPLEGGVGLVAVEAQLTGPTSNAIAGMPLNGVCDATVSEGGITGGFCVETDEELRDRLYGFQARQLAFGSICSFEQIVAGMDGVTRVWVREENGQVIIFFVMDEAYSDSIPQPDDVQRIVDEFASECLTSIAFCHHIEAPVGLVYRPEFLEVCPNDIPVATLNENLTVWLKAQIGLGESVEVSAVLGFLKSQYPHQRFNFATGDALAKCNEIYTTAEVQTP